MAKLTITIEDTKSPSGKDNITVRIESDPPFPGPAAEDQTLTPAQQLALNVMEIVHRHKSKRDFPQIIQRLRGGEAGGVASDSDQAEHRRRLFKIRVGERALEAVAAETVAPVAISIQEAKPAYSDLNLVDELLCDMATLLCNALPPTHEAWAKVENYSSITRHAMARLRQAWETAEMPRISASLAAYFRETGTGGPRTEGPSD